MESPRVFKCLPCAPERVRKVFQGKLHKFEPTNDNGDVQCPYCVFTSKKRSTMSEHITRKHADEAGRRVNPYECGYCSEKFVAKTALQHHIKNHHEISYIKCLHPGCRFESKQEGNLCSHYAKKHMNMLSAATVCINTDTAKCNSCSTEFKMHSIAYHVAKCNPNSLFFDGPCKKQRVLIGKRIVFKRIRFNIID